MAADEERTLARLKSLRRELIDPKIKEYRSRIIKRTTSDGMLVEFASVAFRLGPEGRRHNRGVSEQN
jgi:adenylate cyclase